MGLYSPKFPKIQLDSFINYPNAANNIVKITVEEWQDLLHHTHKVTDILDTEGNFIGSDLDISVSGGVNEETFNELKNTVESQAETIATQAETISTQSGIIENLQTIVEANSSTIETQQSAIETLQGLVESLQSQINALDPNSGSSLQGLQVGDWDLDQEGIQDEYGNTIG